jgi:hypothetical protein
MILDIVGAHASWSANRLSVAFDVALEAQSHLDLKTGEIFQSSSRAELRKETDKAIAATLFVTWNDRNAAGDNLPSEMRYAPATRSSESLITLVWRLSDDHLAGFHSLILSGKVPRQAIISFPHDKLGFGWEPDGSGQTWDNEKEKTIPIEDIRFDIPIVAPTPADVELSTAIPDSGTPAFFTDPMKVNFAIIRKLSSIESSLGRLSTAVGFIALVVVILAISYFWH